jgi:HK97 family phage prohead protease
MERLVVNESQIKLSAGEQEAKTMSGYATVFDTLTDLGPFTMSIDKGAFNESIGSDDIVSLFNHDMNLVLGRTPKTLKLESQDMGLYTETILPDHELGQRISSSIARGDITQMSIGFSIESEEMTRGTEDEKTHFHVTKGKLFDISAVTFGQYPQTSVQVFSLGKATEEQLNARLSQFLDEKSRKEELEVYRFQLENRRRKKLFW